MLFLQWSAGLGLKLEGYPLHQGFIVRVGQPDVDLVEACD
jgi:hypothetical protein